MKRLGKLLGLVAACLILAAAVASAAASPTVSTGGVSNVTQTSAVPTGTVNPNGHVTTYYFQWGLTKSYGVNGAARSARGAAAVAVRETARGLIPGTRYHYRLVAVNRYGTTVGRDRSFRTAGHPPPGVSTGPAALVGQTFVTLTGVVNPHGETTSWTFAYGTTAGYGSFTAGGTVPAGSKPVTVAYSLQGLAPGTIFHYELIAKHGSTVTSYGGDRVFMTHPPKRSRPLVRARTRPHRDRKRPFVFTTSGSILGPSSIPAQFACSGDVMIRFLRGRHVVSEILVPVAPNCTFSGQTAFAHRPAHNRHRRVHLRVRVRFLGNGYLARSRAPIERVTAG